MKSTYKVVLTVSDRTILADIIDAVEGKAASIEIETIAPKAKEPAPAPIVHRPHQIRRTSKVNAVILDAMSGGAATVRMLKLALENAGLSPGSLPPSLAKLTKAGQIERVGDGEYALKMAKAAE